jgi:hypothetical protein
MLSSLLSLCLLSSLSPVPFPHLLYTTSLLLFSVFMCSSFFFLLYPIFSSFCLSILISIIITLFSFSPFLFFPPPLSLFGGGGGALLCEPVYSS